MERKRLTRREFLRASLLSLIAIPVAASCSPVDTKEKLDTSPEKNNFPLSIIGAFIGGVVGSSVAIERGVKEMRSDKTTNETAVPAWCFGGFIGAAFGFLAGKYIEEGKR